MVACSDDFCERMAIRHLIAWTCGNERLKNMVTKLGTSGLAWRCTGQMLGCRHPKQAQANSKPKAQRIGCSAVLCKFARERFR